MSPLLQFILALAVIIFAAKSFGYLSTRIGLPAVLGELLVGLVLGPSVLNLLHWRIFTVGGGHLDEALFDLAHLGVLFLMFIAGLEVELEMMRRAGRPAIASGTLGVLFPVGMGAVLMLPFGFDWQQGIFIGLVLAATSVSISAQTLMELGMLRSRVGVTLLGAAVVDDILVILLLSLFTALAAGGSVGLWTVVLVFVKMVAFLVIASVLGVRLIPQLGQAVDRLPISEGVMALVIVVTILYAWAAEVMGGMAAITGAFLAGLLFGRTPLRRHIEPRMHTLAYSWLVPVFFVSIGLETNIREVGVAGAPLALFIVAVAMISKLLGCGIGSFCAGFSQKDALRLGVGMASRGEVGLIVATVGLNTGLIGSSIFASVVLMVLVTTLLTPVLLRMLYPREEIQKTTVEATESSA